MTEKYIISILSICGLYKVIIYERNLMNLIKILIFKHVGRS